MQPSLERENGLTCRSCSRLRRRYFKLCIRNTRDAVPKAVGYFLVRKMQEVLQFELYNQLASADRMCAAL